MSVLTWKLARWSRASMCQAMGTLQQGTGDRLVTFPVDGVLELLVHSREL